MTNTLQKANNELNLKRGWIEFIRKYEPYDWYMTLTFRYDIHKEEAIKRFKGFIRKINESIFDKRFREKKKGVYCVYVIANQMRSVPHFHCLIGGGAYRIDISLYKFQWQVMWHKENGFAEIKHYDHKKGAINYLAEHISKGGELDVIIPLILKSN